MQLLAAFAMALVPATFVADQQMVNIPVPVEKAKLCLSEGGCVFVSQEDIEKLADHYFARGRDYQRAYYKNACRGEL